MWLFQRNPLDRRLRCVGLTAGRILLLWVNKAVGSSVLTLCCTSLLIFTSRLGKDAFFLSTRSLPLGLSCFSMFHLGIKRSRA